MPSKLFLFMVMELFILHYVGGDKNKEKDNHELYF
jgi:hypothetical protein